MILLFLIKIKQKLIKKSKMSKKIKFLVACFFLMSYLNLSPNVIEAAQQPASPTQSSAMANKEVQAVTVIEKILEGKHDAWPGYDLSDAPVVLWFNSGHIYAFNLHSSDSHWRTKMIANTKILYSDEDHWGITRLQIHHKFPMEGQQAYLFHLNLSDQIPYLPFLIFIHERFHPYQLTHFANSKDVPEDYKDNLNPDNLAMIQMEHSALADFLNAPSDQDKTEKLKDFIAIHKSRIAILQPSSILWEKHQQMMEGLADYVSFRIVDSSQALPRLSTHLHLLNLLQAYIHDDKVSDLAVKGRHYGVGASLAYSLDFLNVKDWKNDVQVRGKYLDDLLMANVNLSDADATVRFQQLKQSYDFDNVKLKIADAIDNYQKQLNAALDDYQTQDGIAMVVSKPEGSEVSGGGSDRGMFHLSNGSTISIDNSSISTTTDQNWKLTIKRVPYLIQGQTGDREFKINENSVVKIDQQTFQLKDLIKDNDIAKDFKTLSCKGEFGEFISEANPGVLKVHDHKVCIEYL